MLSNAFLLQKRWDASIDIQINQYNKPSLNCNCQIYQLYKKYINNWRMTEQEQPTVILDANAFITGGGLLEIAAKNKLVTTSAVMNQLRDPKTRDMLQKFVFAISQMEPDKKSVDFITQFARKTGDLSSLSDVDIELLALAHTLHVRKGLADKLRKNPPPLKQKIQQKQTNQQLSESEQSYNQRSQPQSQHSNENKNQQTAQHSPSKQTQQNKQHTQQGQASENTQPKQQITQNYHKQQKDKNSEQKQKQQKQQKQQKGQKEEDDEWIVVPKKQKKKRVQSDDELGADEGWITPKNFDKKMAEGTAKFQNESSSEQEKEEKQSNGISLMTADFAMQNVAIQVGIQLKSLDGRQIKELRRFILQCYLCWKQYKVTDNEVMLCKECGYNSLSKLAYSLTPDGQMVLHRKKGWKPNQKVLEWKQRKYEEQQRKKKHQHARRKKQTSIFDV